MKENEEKNIFKYKSIGPYRLKKKPLFQIITSITIFISIPFAYILSDLLLTHVKKFNSLNVILLSLIIATFFILLAVFFYKIHSIRPEKLHLLGKEIFEKGRLVQGNLLRREYAAKPKPYLFGRGKAVLPSNKRMSLNSHDVSVFKIKKFTGSVEIRISQDTSELVIGNTYDFIFFDKTFYLLLEG